MEQKTNSRKKSRPKQKVEGITFEHDSRERERKETKIQFRFY